MNYKFEEENFAIFYNLMKEDSNVVVELTLLASNINFIFFGWGFGFFSFILKEIWKEEYHNLFSFLLDLTT